MSGRTRGEMLTHSATGDPAENRQTQGAVEPETRLPLAEQLELVPNIRLPDAGQGYLRAGYLIFRQNSLSGGPGSFSCRRGCLIFAKNQGGFVRNIVATARPYSTHRMKQ
jgi:hypothetical protein